MQPGDAKKRGAEHLLACGYVAIPVGGIGADCWDFIALSTTDLLHVRICDGALPLEILNHLRDFPAPPNTRRLLWRVSGESNVPAVTELQR